MKQKQASQAPLCLVKAPLPLFYLLIFIGFYSPARGQFYKPSEKTIRLGEPLSESFYRTVHKAVNAKTGRSTTLKLDEYRDELLILDFWATWCGPCLYSLNKLDSIKAAMATSRFAVVPVTYETAEKATPAFKRFGWDMVSIVADTILSQIFPHDGIPHQVWIKNNKVFAIPKPDYATAENIRRVINGEPVDLVMNINDRLLNPLKPLFVQGNGEVRPYYRTKYSKITRYLPGYRKEKLQYLRNGDTTILYANNLSITELFYEAYEDEVFPCLGYTEYANMKEAVQWKIDNSLQQRFFNPPQRGVNGDKTQDSIYREWLKRNRYGYELRYPGKLSKRQACEIMQKDLSKLFRIYFNIEASLVKGPRHKYLALRLIGSLENTENLLRAKGIEIRSEDSKDRYRRYNTPFDPHFLTRLRAAKLLPDLTITQVVNRTGLSKDFRVNYEFPKAMNGNLELTQRELAKYGLRLTVEERTVPILVIRQSGTEDRQAME